MPRLHAIDRGGLLTNIDQLRFPSSLTLVVRLCFQVNQFLQHVELHATYIQSTDTLPWKIGHWQKVYCKFRLFGCLDYDLWSK